MGLGRHIYCLNRHRRGPLSSISKQTLTLTRTQTPAAARRLSSTDDQEKEEVTAIPLLMMSTPSQPECRYFYQPSNDKNGGMTIKRKIVMDLPNLANHFCFGSSHGYLFTVPPLDSGEPSDLMAYNPFTNDDLPLPPINLPWPYPPSPGRRPEMSGYDPAPLAKAFLSPSLTHLFLLHNNVLSLVVVDRDSDSVSAQQKFNYDPETTDCALYKGRIYAVLPHGELFVFNPDNPEEPPVFMEHTHLPLPYDKGNFSRSYLVVSPDGDDLFFLYRRLRTSSWQNYNRYPLRTNLFKVFKLLQQKGGDVKDCKWERVKTTGGLAMFVGVNHSVSRRADGNFAQFLKPNCIYFTDDDTYSCRDKKPVYGDMGVFCLDDGKTIYYDMGDGSLVFDWPPPVWVAPPAEW